MKSYTDRKQAWAEKMIQRGKTAAAQRSSERLPPGQHLARGKIPVLDLGGRPEVPLATWQLQCLGALEQPRSFSWQEIQALPQVETRSDFHCVTTWSAFDCPWGGISLTTLLDLIRPTETAKFVIFTSYDGYTTNVPIDALMHEHALLCTRLDGQPLPVEYGGPARIIIPHLYAWKSAKFIHRLEFRATDAPGYWEQRGYNTTADPWLEDRFSKDLVSPWDAL